MIVAKRKREQDEPSKALDCDICGAWSGNTDLCVECALRVLKNDQRGE